MLTVKQAAQRVGVSVALVYSWVNKKLLPHFRFGAGEKGGKVMIEEADLEAFVQSRKVGARPEPAAPEPKPRGEKPKFRFIRFS